MASGTDPLEGGALGMSFLDHFLEGGVTVLGTTHHGALKNFAYTRPRVRNASVEFDDGSSRPTYRLLPDVPGPSHALETASRVGVPDAIVAQAAGCSRAARPTWPRSSAPCATNSSNSKPERTRWPPASTISARTAARPIC